MKYKNIIIICSLVIVLGGCGSLQHRTTSQENENNQIVEVVEEKQELVATVDTENQATQLVLEYLQQNKKYIPAYVEVESETDDLYVVHCYDLSIDPITKQRNPSTVARYHVDKKTGEVSIES